MIGWKTIRWNCHYCKEKFKSFENLNLHQEIFHQLLTATDSYFDCSECNNEIHGYSTFLSHMRESHFESLKLCCDVCNKVLPDRQQLSRHRNKHNEMSNGIHPVIYHCTQCEEVCSTKELLKYHLLKSHKLEKLDWKSIAWKCHYCKEKFESFENLNLHQEIFHQLLTATDTCFDCSECKNEFLGYSTFLNHIRQSHFESLKLCCDVCNEFLPDNQQLSRHRDQHNELNNLIHPAIYHCTVCEKVYSTEKLLKRHLQESHDLLSANRTKQDTFLCQDIKEEVEECDDNADLDNLEFIKIVDEHREIIQILPYNNKQKETILSQHVTDKGQECYDADLYNLEFIKSVGKQREINHILSHEFLSEDEHSETKDILSQDLSQQSAISSQHYTDKGQDCNAVDCGSLDFIKSTLREYAHSTNKMSTQHSLYTKTKEQNSNESSKHAPKHLVNISTSVDIVKNEEFGESEQIFQCGQCVQNFKSANDLMMHISSHNDAAIFTCHVCGMHLSSRYNLNNHILLHGNEKPFQCDVCFMDFKVKTHLEHHRKVHSTTVNDGYFKCNVCLVMFQINSSLECHTGLSRNGSIYTCDACFNRRNIPVNELKINMNEIKIPVNELKINMNENKRGYFKCNVCSIKYKLKSSWEIVTPELESQCHMGFSKNERIFMCDTCSINKNTKDLEEVDKEVRVIDEYLECTTCSFKFKLASELKRHMETQHENDISLNKLHRCDVCRKEYKMCHKHDHTYPFKCDICSKEFSTKRFLKRHMASHFNERPYNCKLCPMKFKIKCGLTRHTRLVHTEEQPSKCGTCQRTYTTKEYLKRHEKLHLKEQKRRKRRKSKKKNDSNGEAISQESHK